MIKSGPTLHSSVSPTKEARKCHDGDGGSCPLDLLLLKILLHQFHLQGREKGRRKKHLFNKEFNSECNRSRHDFGFWGNGQIPEES